MNSDTPVVDADEQWAEWNGNEFQCVHSSTARELERHARALESLVSRMRNERSDSGGFTARFAFWTSDADKAIRDWRAFCEEKLK